MGNFFSRVMVFNFKKNILKRQKANLKFQEIIKQNYECLDKWTLALDKKHTTWKMDKYFISKINGVESIYEYYYHVSSEHVIERIKVPTLCLNTTEDPICLKENIPIEKLFINENIITLITQRGGHIEYLSGKNNDWFGFQLGLHYFKFFESQKMQKKSI